MAYFKTITLNGAQLKTVASANGAWSPELGVAGSLATPTFTVNSSGNISTSGTLGAGATTLSGVLDLSNNGINNAGAIAGASTITATGQIQGGTLTDGTLSISAGSITGGVAATFSGAVEGGTLTDGTLSINAGSITGGVAATFSGAVQGGSLTDGTLTINAGSITGGVAATFSGAVQGGSLTDGTATLSAGSLTGAVNITASGQVQGGTLTDGTLSINAGSITGGVAATFSGAVQGGSITDGTATLSAGSLTGAVNITASGQVQGGTLTDGTLSINAGSITGGVAATFSGQVQAGTFTDGTLTINAGSITNGVAATFSGAVQGGSLTDGTATLSAGSLTGAVNITASGQIQGGTLTDGSLSINGGSITGGVAATFSGAVQGGSLTDGTATLSAGSLTGAVNVTASGTIQGGTLTDGTFSVTGGAITGATTINAQTLSTSGDVLVGGDLLVTGDIVSRGATEVVVTDAFLELNNSNDSTTNAAAGYVATTAKSSNIAFFASEFTAGGGGSSPSITLTADGADADSTHLSAQITMANNANNNDTIVIDDLDGDATTFTFLSGGAPGATDVLIGGDVQATITNFVAKLNAYVVTAVNQFVAQNNSTNSASGQILLQYTDQSSGTNAIDTAGFTAGGVTKDDFSNIPRMQTGQFIQVFQLESDDTNGGLYVVNNATPTANTITLKSSTTNTPFAQTQVQSVTETGDKPKITFVDLYAQAVSDGILSDPGGAIPVGTLCQNYQTFATEASFNGTYSEIGAGTVTLQNAYDNGNTITTAGSPGALTITGDQNVSISSSGASAAITLNAFDASAAVGMYVGVSISQGNAVAVANAVTAADIAVSGLPSAGANLTLEGYAGVNYIITFQTTGSSDAAFATSGGDEVATISTADPATNNQTGIATRIASLFNAVGNLTGAVVGSTATITNTATVTPDTALIFTTTVSGGNVTIATNTDQVMAIPANCGVNSGSTQFVGIAGSTTTAGNTGDVIVSGTFVATGAADPNGAVAGQAVYVHSTNGQLTATAPTAPGNVIFQAGLALSSGTNPRVLLQPQFIAEIL